MNGPIVQFISHALNLEKKRISLKLLNFRAAFYGGLIVLLQTSPESANIFRLIQQLNMAQDMKSLQASVVGKNGVTDEDFQSFLGTIHI